MALINPNDPAFPIPLAYHDRQQVIIDATEYNKANGGMSIRTQLAAMAMQGMLGATETNAEKYTAIAIASAAVQFADALIAELNK